MFGSVLVYAMRSTPRVVDDTPSFRISAPELALLPFIGRVVESGRTGRVEVRQYGRLHNRDMDLAVVLVMPPKSSPMSTEFAQDLRSLNLLGSARAYMSGQNYDLETR